MPESCFRMGKSKLQATVRQLRKDKHRLEEKRHHLEERVHCLEIELAAVLPKNLQEWSGFERVDRGERGQIRKKTYAKDNKKSLGHLLTTGLGQKFELVKQMAMEKQHSIQRICKTLEITRSGYYAHLNKNQRIRKKEDQKLMPLIKESFLENRKTYGSVRMVYALRHQGVKCGKNRMRRLMKQLGLKPVQKKRWKPKTTDSRHPGPIAPNRLKEMKQIKTINQVWLSDITYLPTQEGWLYLAGTMDACSRKIIGWTTRETLHTEIVTEALDKALKKRTLTPGPCTILIGEANRLVITLESDSQKQTSSPA